MCAALQRTLIFNLFGVQTAYHPKQKHDGGNDHTG